MKKNKCIITWFILIKNKKARLHNQFKIPYFFKGFFLLKIIVIVTFKNIKRLTFIKKIKFGNYTFD